MRKVNLIAIIAAILMSVILIPLLLLFEFSGGTALALSNVFKESREDELFAEFEKEGGIRFVYREVEQMLLNSKENLGIPEDASLLEGVITYEDVSSISYGVYSALLADETYYFDLTVQKERIKKNAEEYYDKRIEEEELPDGVDKEYIKSTYLEEICLKIDTEIERMEQELNESLASIYNTQEMQEIERFKEHYGIKKLNVAWFSEAVHTILKAEIIAIVMIVLLLLVSYLFRPTGFIVAGATMTVSGILMLVFSAFLKVLPLPEVIFADEVLDAGIYAVCEKVVTWVMEGYLQFGTLSMGAGAVLLVLGTVLLVFRRRRLKEAEPQI